jgi:hypothetical protein
MCFFSDENKILKKPFKKSLIFNFFKEINNLKDFQAYEKDCNIKFKHKNI